MLLWCHEQKNCTTCEQAWRLHIPFAFDEKKMIKNQCHFYFPIFGKHNFLLNRRITCISTWSARKNMQDASKIIFVQSQSRNLFKLRNPFHLAVVQQDFHRLEKGRECTQETVGEDMIRPFQLNTCLPSCFHAFCLAGLTTLRRKHCTAGGGLTLCNPNFFFFRFSYIKKKTGWRAHLQIRVFFCRQKF